MRDRLLRHSLKGLTRNSQRLPDSGFGSGMFS
jgi:hypothetical protein